eukprot:scaffold16161_cov72-Phaeocystis_antarctica.AAC.2
MSAVVPTPSAAFTSRPGAAVSSAVTTSAFPVAAKSRSPASSSPASTPSAAAFSRSWSPQRPCTARAASATSCAALLNIACRNTGTLS